MKSYAYMGYVRGIESSIDTDVLTVEYSPFALDSYSSVKGLSNRTMDVVVKHDDGIGALFRRGALIKVEIDEGDELVI